MKTKPVVLSIDHVQLVMPVGGEPQARAFYEGLLGIPEVPKPPLLAKRGGCWFKREGLQVHIAASADFRPATKAHPGFIVSDLAQFRSLLAANGYELTTDEPLEGYDRVFVHDPFGNRIELLEVVPGTVKAEDSEGKAAS